MISSSFSSSILLYYFFSVFYYFLSFHFFFRSEQTWTVSSTVDYRRVDWGLGKAGGCRGYILFLPPRPSHAAYLLSYLSGIHPPWDHGGKYLVLGLKEEDIKALARTPVASKTEHLTGIVQVRWFILPFLPTLAHPG